MSEYYDLPVERIIGFLKDQDYSLKSSLAATAHKRLRHAFNTHENAKLIQEVSRVKDQSELFYEELRKIIMSFVIDNIPPLTFLTTKEKEQWLLDNEEAIIFQTVLRTYLTVDGFGGEIIDHIVKGLATHLQTPSLSRYSDLTVNSPFILLNKDGTPGLFLKKDTENKRSFGTGTLFFKAYLANRLVDIVDILGILVRRDHLIQPVRFSVTDSIQGRSNFRRWAKDVRKGLRSLNFANHSWVPPETKIGIRDFIEFFGGIVDHVASKSPITLKDTKTGKLIKLT